MFEVGQKLWWVSGFNWDNGSYLEIKKVGRRWLTTTCNNLIDKKTLKVGRKYTPNGQCYLSKEDYYSKMELEREWNKIRDLHYRVDTPPGVTVDDIHRALVILKIVPNVERLPDPPPEQEEGDVF